MMTTEIREKLITAIAIMDEKGGRNPEDTSWMLFDKYWDDVRTSMVEIVDSIDAESLTTALVRAGICPECGCTETMNAACPEAYVPGHYLWCPACGASLAVEIGRDR